jgi:hypothetical protein
MKDVKTTWELKKQRCRKELEKNYTIGYNVIKELIYKRRPEAGLPSVELAENVRRRISIIKKLPLSKVHVSMSRIYRAVGIINCADIPGIHIISRKAKYKDTDQIVQMYWNISTREDAQYKHNVYDLVIDRKSLMESNLEDHVENEIIQAELKEKVEFKEKLWLRE